MIVYIIFSLLFLAHENEVYEEQLGSEINELGHRTLLVRMLLIDVGSSNHLFELGSNKMVRNVSNEKFTNN